MLSISRTALNRHQPSVYATPDKIKAPASLHHSYRNVDHEWIVGNPWPDIVIHGVFVLAYSLLVYMAARGPSGWRGSLGKV